jgi:putative oxidoreductase
VIRALYPPAPGGRTGVALLGIRAIVGVAFIFHARMKLPEPFFWMGPHGFAPQWLQGVVTFAEFFGGIALIAGLLVPLVCVLLSIDMIVAILKFHIPAGGHFVGGRASFEVPLVYLVVLVGLLLAGPGRYSIDALIFGRR